MRSLPPLALCVSLVASLLALGSSAQANDATATPQTAACTSSVGPGIPPPSSVPSGIPGFHAAWYGQSGYMTLCPGDTATAVVAMYNSGSNGWVSGVLGQVAYLGTWNPIPGQDQPSALGGDGQLGSPATGWPRYNRVAVQPSQYVGPNQVSWFQFGIKAPQTPGTYDLYIRPLIEGAQWMEDYGIFWRITVPPTAPIGAPAKLGCAANPASITAGSTQTSTITVTVQDANGLAVTNDNGRNITLSQAGTTSSLDGLATGASSTKATVNGVATFSLAASGAGATGTDQLSAATGVLTGCIANVNFVNAGAPTNVGVTLAQAEFPAGSPMTTTVTATLKDASGANSSYQTATTATFSANNSSVCSVAPTSNTISAGASSATSTVTTTGSPGSCTITASVPNLQSGSATLSVLAAGPAYKLAIIGNTCNNTPTTSSSPTSSCAVTVQVQDAGGNKIFASTGITLGLYKVGTSTLCNALTTSTDPPGGTGNPTSTNTSSTTTTAKFTISDSIGESCSANATSPGLVAASSVISFSGPGAATQLTATASPNPIPANGASTSTITVCVKDAAGNIVTSANDQINLFFNSSTGGTAHGTTLTSPSPQTASSGCASFTVTSTTNPPATDTYNATDLTRSVTSATVSVTTQ